jgi:hypothetical protein
MSKSIEEIKKLAEQSTPTAGCNREGLAFECRGKEGEAYFHVELPAEADSAFFFDARNDVLALCEMLAGDLVYVPGDWFCPTCGYRQHQRILYAQSGDVGINRAEPDPCPNDGTPMQRLTWKQDAEDANRAALDLIKQVRRLEERLYELEPRH